MNEVFFPSRNWLGIKSKDQGLFFQENGIKYVRTEGFKKVESLISHNDISSIQHFTKFSFMFLLFVYRIQILNVVGIIGKSGEMLIPLKVGYFDLNTIVNICIEISKRVSNLATDETIRSVIEKNSKSPLVSNYWKAVLRGMKWWIIILGGFLVLAILVSIFGN